jgi:hypothetical protein
MADFNIDAMAVNITFGKVHADQKYILPRLIIPVKIKSHSLISGRGSAIDDQPEVGFVFTNLIMKVSVTERVQDGINMIIGYASPETLNHEIKGQDKNIEFGLTLDHYLLSQIEKLRNNDNLYLGVDLRGQGYALQDNGKIIEQELNQETIVVSKSDWVEEVLNQLNYKSVALIEVPILYAENYTDIIKELNDAWKQYSMGEYKQVLGHCRNALDGIATKVKEAGFKISNKEGEFKCPNCSHTWTKSDINKADETEVPDWKEFFDSEKRGKNIREIFRNTRGFAVPGAHFGKVMSKEEADFVLFQTYSIVKYVISRFKDKKSEA